MTRPIGSKNRKSLGPRKGLNLRISEADRAAFDAAAARAQVTTSTWARTVLRREAGLWTGQREERTMGRYIETVTTVGESAIETLAIECADEAWAVLLQGATVSRIDGETMSDNGTETRSVTAWEPMQGDWEALDEMLGHKATRDERAAFEVEYVDRLWSLIKAVE